MARRSMKIRNPLHHLLCVVLQEYNLRVGSYDPDHDDLPLQEKEVRETHLQLSHPGDVGGKSLILLTQRRRPFIIIIFSDTA